MTTEKMTEKLESMIEGAIVDSVNEKKMKMYPLSRVSHNRAQHYISVGVELEIISKDRSRWLRQQAHDRYEAAKASDNG